MGQGVNSWLDFPHGRLVRWIVFALTIGSGQENEMLTGLLLGAGASYECGMPMVWELTQIIRSFATPELLKARNARSKLLNLGVPDYLIDEQISLLKNNSMNYESIIGNLETSYRRFGGHGDGQHYHHLRQDLTEMVYFILLDRHIKLQSLLPLHLRLLDGVIGLANENRPLWIFSLNHDLLIESLASVYEIPISSGFFSRISFPLPIDAGTPKEIYGEVLTEDQISKTGMNFLSQERGINLFKLHGSLDVFSMEDGKKHVKFLPINTETTSVIKTVMLANKELRHKFAHAPHIRATNEIFYMDSSEKLQFLRRSILTGPYKFRENRENKGPGSWDFISHFQSNMNHISTLIVVGYGFGDLHVNVVVRNWLQFTHTRIMEIIDPFRKDIPTDFLHLAPQIKITNTTAIQYFEKYSLIPLSKNERKQKEMFFGVRDKLEKTQIEAGKSAYGIRD